MDDLREKLAKLTGINGPTSPDSDTRDVHIEFDSATDAHAAFMALIDLKDEATNGPMPSHVEDAAGYAAAFIKGARDNAHLLQGGDAIDPVDAPLKGGDLMLSETGCVEFIDGKARFSCANDQISRAFVDISIASLAATLEVAEERRHERDGPAPTSEYDRGYAAGYDAARPLDPGTIRIVGESEA